MTRGNETGKKLKKTDARSARLAAALRVNLHRRKAQERRRGEESAPADLTKPSPAPNDDKTR
jgi:hypothetical protein